MINKLHEDVVHLALCNRPLDDDDEMATWLEWLEQKNEFPPASKVTVMGGEVITSTSVVYSELVLRMGDQATDFGQKCLKWLRDIPFFSRFGGHDLIRDFSIALVDINPELSLELWQLYFKLSSENNYMSGYMDRWPFKGKSQTFGEARKLTIERATTDQRLFNLVIHCQEEGASDWLISFIKKEWKADEVGRVARAIQIAGYLDKTEDADNLWLEIETISTLSKWLFEIRKKSYETYQRNAQARQWFKIFLDEENWDVAFGSYNLFLSLVDIRFNIWASAYKPWEKEGLHYHHYLLTHHMINGRNKKPIDSPKKTFCGMKIPQSF